MTVKKLLIPGLLLITMAWGTISMVQVKSAEFRPPYPIAPISSDIV
jgi:hypothetical protein